jgi:FAD/FMN-containing dehydrogenase
MPFVAEEHHGKLVIMALLCHAGESVAGERVLARFRGLADPGTTWDRLATVKARYDPANLFRLNQKVPPAASG